MSWNHRAKIAAIAVTIQTTPGVFEAPNPVTDLIAVSGLNNADEIYSAQDPTLTGAIWDTARIYLGQTSNINFTLPLRGPGGANPPAADGWPVGRLFRAAAFSEIVQAAAVADVTTAGSTVSGLALAAGSSSVDDFLVGVPIQNANIGAAGTVKGTSLITDYDGDTKLALIGETIVAPNTGDAYTIPPHIAYVLGTATTPPPRLSISVWRDKVRYDYKDCVAETVNFDVPVANEANTSFPSIEFAFKGIFEAKADDTTPTIGSDVVGIVPPANRGGKFALDRVFLGHANMRLSLSLQTGAASNANQPAGQDGYDILGGSRSVELDLNQMNVTDFDLDARVASQVPVPALSMWGAGAGNNFALAVNNMVLDPGSTAERNGYVSLNSGGQPVDVDKSVSFTIWW